MEKGKFNQRTDYVLNESLKEGEVSSNPFDLFHEWYEIALKHVKKDPNAMTLSTYDGVFPRGRVVLLKELDHEGFVFFTNYQSDKGRELEMHPNASVVFYWKELERQVRVQGKVVKTSEADSDGYFLSRPLGSRLGAWASPQSKVIPSREWLVEQVEKKSIEFESKVHRPSFWGGYRLIPEYLEFWQGQSSRLHDRIVFEKGNSGWVKKRLAP